MITLHTYSDTFSVVFFDTSGRIFLILFSFFFLERGTLWKTVWVLLLFYLSHVFHFFPDFW